MNKSTSHKVEIFIAGDIAAIKSACRRFTLRGLCVTVSPTEYIFTGGAESGAVVGLINYARFPLENAAIDAMASELARNLMIECCQRSCSIVSPVESIYMENDSISVAR